MQTGSGQRVCCIPSRRRANAAEFVYKPQARMFVYGLRYGRPGSQQNSKSHSLCEAATVAAVDAEKTDQ